ncbi:MAG TPA: hypothetical protein PKZ97_07000 [Azospirillaceae bacterium]|nr:hypothetical protein [Azospirillaceae bacterium]HRQ80849.1 hypothetical protein [Azospirillaceae bacterium]
MLMSQDAASGRDRAPKRQDAASEELNRHHDAIIGLERRLASAACDVGVARMALARHYSAFALGMVRRMGGDVRVMKTLTDRNNIIPLAGGVTAD